MNRVLKRVISIMVCAALVISCVDVSCARASEGQSDEYTEIYTIEDLVAVNSNPAGKYILMADIDISEETDEGGSYDTGNGWTPLNNFSGVFDGNGHRIKGMNIYGKCSGNVGLFSDVSGAVENLGIVDCTINTPDNQYVGGIAGLMNGGTVSGCYVTGNITGKYTGGLIGCARNSKSNIKNCYNNATITGSASGGILGYNLYGSQWYNISISNCYNTGKVTYAIYGGSNNNYISKCYYLKDNSTSGDGGYALTETQMKSRASFTGFDFDGVWEMDANSAYEYPQLQRNCHHRVSGISIKKDSIANIEYFQGDKLDVRGGEIEIIYEDARSVDTAITEDMIKDCDMMKLGEQTVTVAYRGQTDTFIINVKPVIATGIKITAESNCVKKGGTLQLSAEFNPSNTTDKAVTWTSSDEDIATVDDNGLVTAKKAGNVKITVKTSKDLVAEYDVYVTVACTSIEMGKAFNMYSGTEADIPVKISPSDCTDVISWMSSNETVATVKDGKVTAHLAGETTITVKASNGTTARCIIYVKQMPAEGTGSEPVISEAEPSVPEGYTAIYTIEDLVTINSNTAGKYILMADIDISEETAEGGSYDTGNGWTPLKGFSGVFDGNGHRIKGMNIYGICSGNVGLFSSISGGEVKNLGIVDCTVNTPDNQYVGGIAGLMNGGTVSGCYVTGNITGKYTGGLIGCARDSKSNIKNCYNNATITGSASGGILGYNLYGSQWYNISISNCYNTGKVTYAIYGGSNNNYISKCYYLKDNSTSGAGGYALTETQMKSRASFTGFDFDDVWEMDANSTYEYPQLQGNCHHRVSGISIKKDSIANTTYFQGDKLDISGGEIEIIYEDARKVDTAITEDMIIDCDMMKLGEQTVTVAYRGQTDTFTINVKPVIATGIKITAESKSVRKGGTLQLSAEFNPSNTTDKTVTWTSSDEKIATVDSNGIVTARTAGSVSVSALTINGLEDTYGLNVTVACTSIEMGKAFNMYSGTEADIPVKISPSDCTDVIRWTSSNETAATVKDGKVTAHLAGETTITAKAANGTTARCIIYVKQMSAEGTGSEPAISETEPSVPEGYEGYTAIYTIEDLVAINSNTAGKYILMADIDISEETAEGGSYDTGNGWTPIKGFSGVFDGNGHRIKGMNIYGKCSGNVGLFSSISGGEVKNLGIVDCTINTPNNQYVGGIAGLMNEGTISGCYVTGTIEAEYDNSYSDYYGYVGGLVGYAYDSTDIINCYNDATVTSSERVGGILGGGDSGSDINISNCYNTGKVKYAICGYAYFSYEEISNCYYLQSNITESALGYYSDSERNCHALTETQMKSKVSFIRFDFDNVWEMDANSTYDYPQLQSNRHHRVSGISIKKGIANTTYFQGDKLEVRGGEIEIIYEDARSVDTAITEDMIKDCDMMKIGEQTVTVAYRGQTDTFTINVKPVIATGIKITAESNSVEKGGTLQLSAEFNPSNTTDKTVTWTSSEENIASVDGNGLVTAKKAGSIKITVKTSNNLTAEYDVYVTVACTSIEMGKAFNMYSGTEADIPVKISPSDCTDVISWTSSNETAATVKDGKVTARLAGETTITAKAPNGKTARCIIYVKQKPEEGTGTEPVISEAEPSAPEGYEGYTAIYTIEDLAAVNSNPAGKYILMADIDISEETAEGGSYDTGNGWTPLKAFSGVFDGNGHRIKGMNIYGTCSGYVGLFSSVSGGEVKNLGIVDCTINTPNNQYVGGIAGDMTRETVSGCYVTGNITGKTYVGGLVGRDNYSSISDCYNNATVKGSYSGGILGSSGTFGSNNNDNCKTSNCYNTGKVTYGICGYKGSYFTISKCYYLKDNSTKALSGNYSDSDYDCHALTETQMKSRASFTGFDFDGVWEMDANSTYEYPQLQSNRHHRVSGISIKKGIANTEYFQGDEIDVRDGEIEIIYEDAKKYVIAISEDMIKDCDMMKLGEQTVTVAYRGQTDTFTINVKPVIAAGIRITAESNSVKKGGTLQLSAEFIPSNTTDKTVTWTSSDEKIATVDSNGIVTAKTAGAVSVSALTINGLEDTYGLNVTVACTSIEMGKAFNMYSGTEADIPVKISPSDCTDVISWTSSNETAATVKDGKVTARLAGETTITAKAPNGTTARCIIYVKQMPAGETGSEPAISEAEPLVQKGYTAIYTIEDLVAINSNPKGNYILMADIDISEETAEGGSYDTGNGWTPLKEFSGVFDGNGHCIKGMNIYGTCSGDVGLFSYIRNGEVRNLGIVDCTVNTPNNENVGGIAGYMKEETISGCYVTGSITGKTYVGGLIGRTYSTSYNISDCYNNATVKGSYSCGIVGDSDGFSSSYIGKISNCYNTGKVTYAICGYGYIPVSKCYYLKDNSTQAVYNSSDSAKDCYVLTETQMKSRASFTGFDFDSVWEMDANSTYEYPQLQSNRHHRVSGISIKNGIANTTYFQGDKLDVRGGEIEIIYEDARSVDTAITEDMIKDCDMMKLGEQTVTLAYRGQTDTFTINVKPVIVTGIKITAESNSVEKGGTLQLSAEFNPSNTTDKTVTWTSSEENIASVDGNGLVTAKKAGSIKITVKTSNNLTAEYDVYVTVACTSIEMGKAFNMYSGTEADIPVKISPSDCTDVISWISSNETAATVKDGKVTARLAGETTITAKAPNGKTARCIIYVKQKPEEGTESEPVISEAEPSVSEGYTEVYTIEDLAAINSNPKGNYILMADIDISEETAEGGSYDTGNGWTPLKAFSGVFNGNGHRIKGMNIYGTCSGYVGLFSSVSGGEVKNLGIVDCTINTPNNQYVGGIAGRMNEGTISGCYVTGTIEAEYDNSYSYYYGYVGGLVGYAYDSTDIINCYNDATVMSSERVGGILGGGDSGSDINISNCYNTGKVKYAICGYAYFSYEEISNCYYLQSNITESALNYYSDSERNCRALTETQMKSKVSFTGFDFNDVWEMDVNSTYKYPQLKNNRHQRINGIIIETPVNKTEYYQGEKLNLDGGTIKIALEDAISTTTIHLNESMLDDYDMMQLGEQQINITYGGITVGFTINIKEIPVENIRIKHDTNTVERGSTLPLSAVITPENASDRTVTWTSSDEEIATVNSNGIVTAKTAGAVSVSALTANGLEDTCELNVIVSCTSLDMEENIIIGQGEEKTLKLKKSPVDTTDEITWTSSNERIATVQDGVVTGHLAGTATITAKASGGVSKKCTVAVKSKLDGIKDDLSDDITITDTVPDGYKAIYSIEDLAGINNDTAGSYILMDDIDISKETSEGGSWDAGMGWTPLDEFSGIFNGNGHRIIGMNIYGNSAKNVGLFSTVIGGVIKNLAITDCTIEVSADNCGAVAGYISNSIISECYVTGKIKSDGYDSDYYDNDSVGGLIGHASYSTIDNSYNCAEITAGSKAIAGGIAGYISDTELEFCYNVGNIKGNTEKWAGAVCGIASNCDIASCYYLNTTSDKGIHGDNYYYNDYDNNYSKEVNALTVTQMRTKSKFTGFDFEGVWELDANSSYMYPQLKYNRHERITGLDISSYPKTEYNPGGQLETDNIILKLIYEDGYEKELYFSEEFLISEYDMMKVGEQVITISYGDKTVSFTITVKKVEATGLSITADKNTIEKGSGIQLGIKLEPSNAEAQSVTWSSSDTSIAVVNENGYVSAKREGTVIITAVLDNGLSATYTFNVVLPTEHPNNTAEPKNTDKGDDAKISSSLGKVTIVKAKKSGSKKIYIKYKKVKGAKSYEIRYSTSSKMKNAKTKKKAGTSCTISKLKKKKYFVQVRAVGSDSNNNKIYGAWSKKVKIKLK